MVSLGPHGHVDGNFGAVQSQRHADANTTEDATDVGVEDVRAAGVGLAAFAPREHIAQVARDARGDSPRDAEDDLGRTRARAALVRASAPRRSCSPRAPPRVAPPRVMRPRPTPRRPAASRVRPAPAALEADASPAPTRSPPPSPDWFPAGLALGGAGLLGGGFQLDGPASTAQAIAVLASIIFVHECGHFFAARLKLSTSPSSPWDSGQPLVVQGTRGGVLPAPSPSADSSAFPDDDPDCPYPEDDPDLLRNRLRCSTARRHRRGRRRQRQLAPHPPRVNTVDRRAVETRRARVAAVERFRGEGLRRTRGGRHRGRQRRGGIRRAAVQSGGSSSQLGATPLRLSLLREGAPVNVDVTPNVSPAGEGRIGVQLEANAEMTKRVARRTRRRARVSRRGIRTTRGARVPSLFSLVSDFESAKGIQRGPIAIVRVRAEVMRTSDLSGLYQFASVININLAVVNILPLPALDGGFLFLIAVEALRGGRNSRRKWSRASPRAECCCCWGRACSSSSRTPSTSYLGQRYEGAGRKDARRGPRAKTRGVARGSAAVAL